MSVFCYGNTMRSVAVCCVQTASVKLCLCCRFSGFRNGYRNGFFIDVDIVYEISGRFVGQF